MATPFNLFPYKAVIPDAATGTKTSYDVTRAIYDGTTLRIYHEKKNVGIYLVYSQENTDVWTKGTVGSLTYRWVDQESGKQGFLGKYSGCGCKYNKGELVRTLDPGAE